MSYTTKPFEELDIMDDFLMNATADDEEVGEEFSKTQSFLSSKDR